MTPFALVSQALGLGSAAGTRAGLGLLAVAVAALTGHVTLPPELTWVARPGPMAAFAVVLGFETLMYRDDDLRELLGLVQYGLSAASGALVMVATLKAPLGGVPGWVLGVGGALLAMGSLTLRRRLHSAVDRLDNAFFRPLKWLIRLEEVGTVGLGVALFLAPPLALAFAAVQGVSGLVAGGVEHRVEARFRRPCPACAAAIRKEASCCPKCRAEVPVVKQLDLRLPGKRLTSTAPSSPPTPAREGPQEPSSKTG
jgi:uncharacterized protein DUF4126